jgi:hypothetical protein
MDGAESHHPVASSELVVDAVDAGRNRPASIASPAPLWRSSRAGVVTFYLPDQQALQGRDPETLDCDRDWAVFGTGVYVWVLQTFVRLRDAHAPVRLSKTAPQSGIVLTHADYVERLLAEAPSAANLTIVSARADRPQQIYADIEIVQNASSVEDFQIFIPSWLQPGLIARNADRGTRVETIGYIGARKQLHPDCHSSDWVDALRSRGLNWDPRLIKFGGNDQLYSDHRWNDYATIDVVVAMRPTDTWDVASKPAAKLANAWAAGVPAIVSPEIPYKELRRSSLDYLEARSGAEALQAIDRLRSNPALYADMIANGRDRAREFDHGRLTERWIETLWRTVPARTKSAAYRLTARLRGYRAIARHARRRLRSSRPIEPLVVRTAG